MRTKVFEKVFKEHLYKALEFNSVWDDRDYELMLHGYKMSLLCVLSAIASSTDAPTYEKYHEIYDSIDWSKRRG